MTNQRVCMLVCTRVRRGLPSAPHAPLCIIRSEEVAIMLVPGDKKLMLKVLWEALKKVIDRFLRKI